MTLSTAKAVVVDILNRKNVLLKKSRGSVTSAAISLFQ